MPGFKTEKNYGNKYCLYSKNLADAVHNFSLIWFMFIFGCYLTLLLVIKHTGVSIIFFLWKMRVPERSCCCILCVPSCEPLTCFFLSLLKILRCCALKSIVALVKKCKSMLQGFRDCNESEKEKRLINWIRKVWVIFYKQTDGLCSLLTRELEDHCIVLSEKLFLWCLIIIVLIYDFSKFGGDICVVLKGKMRRKCKVM